VREGDERPRQSAQRTSPKVKLRGVGQLARQATEIANGGLESLPPGLAEASTLLTLLIVNDPFFDAPGHASLLADEFALELHADRTLGNRAYQKAGLTVIGPLILTVDDFEWLEASLQGFALGEFLREYAQSGRETDVRTFVLSSRFRQSMRNPELAVQSANELVAAATALIEHH
jgi:hypothetical protein